MVKRLGLQWMFERQNLSFEMGRRAYQGSSSIVHIHKLCPGAMKPISINFDRDFALQQLNPLSVNKYICCEHVSI
jgi:hypothetical protein